MREAISNIAHKPWALPLAVGVVSAGGGLTAGYFIGFRRGAQHVIDQVNAELEYLDTEPGEPLEDSTNDPIREIEDEPSDEVRSAVDDILGRTASSIIEEHAENMTDYAKISKEHGYVESESDDEMDEEDSKPIPETAVRHNVFDAESLPWDYDAEIKNREENSDKPYVIHLDEYTRNDMGFRQETMTYYEEDDILADENDVVIHRPDKVIGELQFGHGSSDPNVVYIRNPVLRMEWEILRHHGSYAAIVQGLEIEQEFEEQDLKHSNERKFKKED